MTTTSHGSNWLLRPDDGTAGSGRLDAIVIIVMVLAAMAVRLYLLSSHDVISTDGTGYARAAVGLKRGDLSGISIYGFYPVLVWLANYLIADVELAGRLVSMTAGSLLVVPLYLLGTALYSRSVAIAACLVAMVWPTLLSWSCEVMTQATYTTLVMGGVYLAWRMSRDPAPVWGVMAGALLGLAYLTRPEGLLVFVAVPCGLYLLKLRELRTAWRPLACYLGSFLLLFGLNLLLVHQATGIWQLSAKTGSALTDALQYYLGITDLNYIPGYRTRSYLDILREYPDFLWTNISKNSRDAWRTMLSVPLWLLAGAGFLAGGFGREANIRRLLLLATFAPLLVIILFYYIGPEYTQPYLPGLLLWIGAGAVAIGRTLGTRLLPAESGRVAMVAVPAITLAASLLFAGNLLIGQLPAHTSAVPYDPASDGGRRDQKNVGLILKQALPPGKIMTRWARIAFYADREWMNVPNSDHGQIMAIARANGVRFLVVDGDLDAYRPGLVHELFTPFDDANLRDVAIYNSDPTTRTAPGLMPFFLYRNPASTGVAVYEIVPE